MDDDVEISRIFFGSCEGSATQIHDCILRKKIAPIRTPRKLNKWTLKMCFGQWKKGYIKQQSMQMFLSVILSTFNPTILPYVIPRLVIPCYTNIPIPARMLKLMILLHLQEAYLRASTLQNGWLEYVLVSGRVFSFWVVVSSIFYFHPYLGKIPILTNIFQMG